MRDLEANLQYEYMDKVRGYVKQQEEQIGRPLTFYVKTFGCQMNARDSETVSYTHLTLPTNSLV